MSTRPRRVSVAAALATVESVSAAGTAMAWPVCHQMRESTEDMLAQVHPGVTGGAVGHRRRPACGRGDLGGKRADQGPPPETSRGRRRAAGADCLV